MFPTLPALSKHLLSKPFKRAQTGLFHGSLIQFGNNVPFSKHKTRRTWLPNIQHKGLFSDLLGRELRLKVTTRSLRTIRKYGGLDQYILNTRHELLGPEGMRIRIMLREKQEQLARQAAQEARSAKPHPAPSPTRLEADSETKDGQVQVSGAGAGASLGAGTEKMAALENKRLGSVEDSNIEVRTGGAEVKAEQTQATL
ncbi:hypothetical protein ACEPAF_2771 [Sanghuangporus sanghuang]